jgi:hypothetical protein
MHLILPWHDDQITAAHLQRFSPSLGGGPNLNGVAVGERGLQGCGCRGKMTYSHRCPYRRHDGSGGPNLSDVARHALISAVRRWVRKGKKMVGFTGADAGIGEKKGRQKQKKEQKVWPTRAQTGDL